MTAAADITPGQLAPGTVVCFQDQGVPRLGVIKSASGSRHEIADEHGNLAKFSSDRFTVFPGLMLDVRVSPADLQLKLNRLMSEAEIATNSLSLEKIWECANDLNSPVSSEEIFDLCNIDLKDGLPYLGLHLLLLHDKVYFKQRGQFFLRRTADEVADRVAQAEELRQHEQRLSTLVDIVAATASGKTARPHSFPKEIAYLEDLAALGNDAPDPKQARVLLETIESRLGIVSTESPGNRAFTLLETIGHFTRDQNLTLIRLGMDRIAQPTLEEIAVKLRDLPPENFANRRDLTGLECFTIDGGKTPDYDDALSIEKLADGGFRIGIHITDVWSALHSSPESFDTALHEAMLLGSSVYLPDKTIHMLPTPLSEDLLSLTAGRTKLTVSAMVTFDSSLSKTGVEFLITRIRIGKNYTYDEANDILTSDPDTSLVPLWRIATDLEQKRLLRPLFSFDRTEVGINIYDSGKISLTNNENDTPAHLLISELMILFNSEMATLGKRHKLPFLYRSQAAPDEDPTTIGLDIPAGPARDNIQRSVFQRTVTECRPFPHAGLGLDCYLQATSPLRRTVDLLNQGQLVNFIAHGQPAYPAKRMHELFREIEPALDRVQIAQRERIRYFFLRYIEGQRDSSLSAVVVKVEHGQPYAELTETLLMAPYEPKSPAISPAQVKQLLGRTIQLKVTEIIPHSGILKLIEA